MHMTLTTQKGQAGSAQRGGAHLLMFEGELFQPWFWTTLL